MLQISINKNYLPLDLKWIQKKSNEFDSYDGLYEKWCEKYDLCEL